MAPTNSYGQEMVSVFFAIKIKLVIPICFSAAARLSLYIAFCSDAEDDVSG